MQNNLQTGTELAVDLQKYLQSCESVLESFVSRFENHFDVRRSTNEDTSNEEFKIAVNGPNVSNCDKVVAEAMDLNWGEKGGYWHFFRTSVLEKLKPYNRGSEVLHRHLNTPNSLPFMS